jgi:hypothetical protein
MNTVYLTRTYFITTNMKASNEVFLDNALTVCSVPESSVFKKITKRIMLLIVLFTLFLSSESVAFGQEFRYQFQLKDVSDLADAKMVTDVLRPVFNTVEVPFRFFPTFIDGVDQFDFVSEIAVTKEELEAVLVANGLALIGFNRIPVVESKPEK